MTGLMGRAGSGSGSDVVGIPVPGLFHVPRRDPAPAVDLGPLDDSLTGQVQILPYGRRHSYEFVIFQSRDGLSLWGGSGERSSQSG